MSETSNFIKRAAERTGFHRHSFVERNMPSHPSNVVAIPFYGDMRGTFLLSSFLLRSYKEMWPEKYLVLCSWPGFQGLFPYVDEYWYLNDEFAANKLATESNNLYNGTKLAAEITRNMVEVLNVLTPKDLKQYYDDGFTKQYWDDFEKIKRFFPEIPAANTSDLMHEMEKYKGKKIIVYPVTKMRSWQKGKSVYLPVSKNFWNTTIDTLLEEGFVPVVYQNWFTYDMSVDYVDKCMYITSTTSDLLSAIRQVGLVLDIHSGISRLALSARCPFLSVDERFRYIESQDYVLDDLCSEVPRQLLFSFSTMLMADGPKEWRSGLLDNVVVRLNKMLSDSNINDLPSTNESFHEISYDRVKNRKAKRYGVTFINSSKNK